MTGDGEFARMREELVARLRKSGAVRSRAVARAFLRVPRHLFVPHVRPDMAYQDVVIPTRWRGGQPVSSSSQPAIMAIMLEALRPEPGQRVLEVGAGSGYNAALLQELVGPEGRVVTVDVDRETAAWARRSLEAAGYRAPLVVEGDGGLGYAPEAPYDRIIVTASSDDVPPAWFHQLREGGVLVLPLRLNGPHFTVALRKEGAALASERASASGFMRLRGAFGAGAAERTGAIGDVSVARDYRGPRLDVRALGALLATVPRTEPLPGLPRQADEAAYGFSYFAALQGVPVALLSTQNPGHGFGNAWAMVDTQEPSACLVRWERLKEGEAWVYGTDAALRWMRAALDRWQGLGRPGLDRLALRLTPLPEPRRRRGQEVAPDEVLTRHWRVQASYRAPGAAGAAAADGAGRL